MTTLSPPIRVRYTPEDVERLSRQEAKHYELIDGELREKAVGTKSLWVAGRISDRLNAVLYPTYGFAVVEAMLFCFEQPNHGRKPDVVYVPIQRLPGRQMPDGDLRVVPDLAVEVLSPGNTAMELDDKLEEYASAGIPMIWMVNPDRKTIRVFRNDGTTRLFRAADTIANEPLLPGFSLLVGDVFPHE